MLASRLDGCLAGKQEQCIVNGSAQDEAEPKPVRSLATSMVAGRMKSFVFKGFKPPARKSRMRRTLKLDLFHAVITDVTPKM